MYKGKVIFCTQPANYKFIFLKVYNAKILKKNEVICKLVFINVKALSLHSSTRYFFVFAYWNIKCINKIKHKIFMSLKTNRG